MTQEATLAISGSNLTGEAPFSCCLRLGDALHTALPAAGERGDIAGLARDLLTAHERTAADITELRVDLGPGSYVGLRVAITFARFCQHFGGARILACDSLAMLASATTAGDRRLRPLLDARRDRFHCAAFVEREGRLQATVEPAAIAFEDVLNSIAPGDAFVVPHGLDERHTAPLHERCVEVIAVHDLTAEQLFAPNLPLLEHTARELEPRYLMASYAE